MCVHLILGKPKALSYQVGYKHKDWVCIEGENPPPLVGIEPSPTNTDIGDQFTWSESPPC